MKDSLPHYGDILKKLERVIDSCITVDQLGCAWKLAEFFDNHCQRSGVSFETRNTLTSTVNNRLNDRWEELMIKKTEDHSNEA